MPAAFNSAWRATLPLKNKYLFFVESISMINSLSGVLEILIPGIPFAMVYLALFYVIGVFNAVNGLMVMREVSVIKTFFNNCFSKKQLYTTIF
jgi:hypothetical protein